MDTSTLDLPVPVADEAGTLLGVIPRVTLLAALLLPVLALLGFAGGGREIGRRAENPAYVTEVMAAARRPNAEQRLVLGRVSDSIFWGHLGMIALVLAARAVREHLRRRQGVRITYPEGREVLVPVGFLLLGIAALRWLLARLQPHD